jgi:hypothetical protein
MITLMVTKNPSLPAIGSSLLEHSQGADLRARAVIGELFPYIIQASKRITTRAISQFLEEKHEVKISFVTIGKALRNPGKYWNCYYDSIEPHAWIVAAVHGDSPLRSFMSEWEKYDDLLKTEKVYQCSLDGTKEENEERISQAMADYEEAVRVLNEKWFCLDDDVLQDARLYLMRRFSEKPQAKHDNEDREQN